LWATTFDSGESAGGFSPVGRPIAVEDGYVFEALKDERAFFYKINPNGKIVSNSPDFKTTGRAADLQVLENGNLFAVYNDPGANENYPSQLTLSTNGQISRQRRLLIAQSLQTDGIYQSLASKGRVSIIGSQDLREASADRYAGFVLQAAIDSSQGTCFRWEDFSSTSAHTSPIAVAPQTVSFFPFNPRYLEAKIDNAPWKFSFAESCDLTKNRIVRIDSTLSCGLDWSVELPNADFIWEDGTPTIGRTFTAPGIYRASDYNCIAPTILEYEVKRDPCACLVYLPNAFSPNDDGQNDQLRLFSNCPLQNVQMSVYSRWGDRLFEGNSAEAAWDGQAGQKPADPGVYMVAVRYQVLDESGNIQEGTLTQKVQLLRN
jgi:gliding motility-associated-like protein